MEAKVSGLLLLLLMVSAVLVLAEGDADTPVVELTFSEVTVFNGEKINVTCLWKDGTKPVEMWGLKKLPATTKTGTAVSTRATTDFLWTVETTDCTATEFKLSKEFESKVNVEVDNTGIATWNVTSEGDYQCVVVEKCDGTTLGESPKEINSNSKSLKFIAAPTLFPTTNLTLLQFRKSQLEVTCENSTSRSDVTMKIGLEGNETDTTDGKVTFDFPQKEAIGQKTVVCETYKKGEPDLKVSTTRVLNFELSEVVISPPKDSKLEAGFFYEWDASVSSSLYECSVESETSISFKEENTNTEVQVNDNKNSTITVTYTGTSATNVDLACILTKEDPNGKYKLTTEAAYLHIDMAARNSATLIAFQASVALAAFLLARLASQ